MTINLILRKIVNKCSPTIPWMKFSISTKSCMSTVEQLFPLMKHSLSLRKASRSIPRPTFSNCIQSDVTWVSFCLTTFRQKKLYTTSTASMKKEVKSLEKTELYYIIFECTLIFMWELQTSSLRA